MKIVQLKFSDGVYTMREAETGISISDELWDEYLAHEAACARWYERLRDIDNLWFEAARKDALTTGSDSP